MKRGPNIPDTSGPQGTRVFKAAESHIDIIEYRHEVAFMTRAYHVDMIAGNGRQLILCGGPAPQSCIAAMFAQPRQTWFYFEKFQKRFALRWKTAKDAPEHEGWWELDGASEPAPPPRPDDGEAEGADGGPPTGPGDGPVYSFSGGFHLPPRRRRQRARPARRGQRQPPPAAPVDKAPPQAQAEQPAAPAKRIVGRLLCKTRRALRTMQLESRFRHIKSQIKASVAEMKALGLLTQDTADAFSDAFSAVARRWLRRGAVELRAFLTDFDHAVYQRPVQLAPKAIELRQGFTLMLYSFDNPEWESWLFGKFERPNWESWLFGRLSEDERLSA